VTDGLSRPNTNKGKLQRECLRVLLAHQEAGELPTSARFVYYELKQAGVDTTHEVRRPDQDVIDALTHLREVGLVPWEWLVDETRTVELPFTADTVTDWLMDDLKIDLDEDRIIDPWHRRPPIVVTESRSLRGVLRAAVRRYGVLIASTNGQARGFLHTEVAPVMYSSQEVAYFGDYNRAGSHIEANTQRVLEECVGPLKWERVALTVEQTEGLPPKPDHDRRYRQGDTEFVSHEAEALGQRKVVRLLTDWLDARLPESLDRVQEREQAQRDRLRKALNRGRVQERRSRQS
jgi:hypothetical protein